MFFDPSGEPREGEPPPAVYARIDSIEPVTGDEQIVLLDCIDANWINENESFDAPPFAQRLPGQRDTRWRHPEPALSIIALQAWVIRQWLGDFATGQWLALRLGNPAHDDSDADQSLNLFAPPTPRGVINILPAPPETQALLDHLAGWGNVIHADATGIEAALDANHDPDAIAIYDVGQGAATALLAQGAPVLYFDLGGSVTGNWRSFPPHLAQFCFCADPPVVLSHWDWDHWSSALRDRRALTRTWLLPDQSASGALGPVHASFLAMLNANAAQLLWWPHTLADVSLPMLGITILRATGPANDRNDSGLAILRDKTKDPRSRSVLLPGDAAFEWLQQAGTVFDHVMVPHHGGKTSLAVLPQATSKNRSFAIYSYGVGNTFLHPLADTVKALRPGWKRNAHTALRTATGFGHIGIDLTGRGRLPPIPPCVGNCQLPLQYWL